MCFECVLTADSHLRLSNDTYSDLIVDLLVGIPACFSRRALSLAWPSHDTDSGSAANRILLIFISFVLSLFHLHAQLSHDIDSDLIVNRIPVILISLSNIVSCACCAMHFSGEDVRSRAPKNIVKHIRALPNPFILLRLLTEVLKQRFLLTKERFPIDLSLFRDCFLFCFSAYGPMRYHTGLSI